MKLTLDSSTPNCTKIEMIGKDSVLVSMMDVAPANPLTHSNAASITSLVKTVDTLKIIHTSSDLIHFVSQQLHVDISSALQ